MKFISRLYFLLLICSLTLCLPLSADVIEAEDENEKVYSQDQIDKEPAKIEVVPAKKLQPATQVIVPAEKATSTTTSATAVKKEVLTLTRASEGPKGGIPIDLNIPKFSDTPQGKAYIQEHGEPRQADENGYPQMRFDSSARQAQALQKKMILIEKTKLKKGKILPPPVKRVHHKSVIKKAPIKKKTTLLKKILDFIMPSAYAYEEDANFTNPGTAGSGLVRCRQTPTQTGYFRIYFEDVMDNTNAGYDDGQNGFNRRQVACSVLEELSFLLNLNLSTIKPDIIFTKNLPPGTPSNAVASASAFFGYQESGKRIDNGTLHLHITSGQDPTPATGAYDAVVNTNWNLPVATAPLQPVPYVWSSDIPGYPVYPNVVTLPSPLQGNYPNAIDFATTIRHEILHALGFAAKIPPVVNQSGTMIVHNLFSEFLYQMQGGAPYFTFQLPMDPIFQVPNSVAPTPWSAWYINNNQGVYQGKTNYPNSTLDPVRPIYTPSQFAPGSSLSHFDMYRANAVYNMHPIIEPWSIRPIHNDEKQVLCHLGYEVVGFCAGKTPFVNSDFTEFTATGTPQCVKFLYNDVSHTGSPTSNLVVHEFQPVSIPAGSTLTFYSNTPDCLGSATSSNPVGARSVKITATSFPVTFKYKVRDTVSNRISDAAIVYATNCASAPDEYVCNGDFELGVTPGFNWYQVNNMAFGQNLNSRVPFWGTTAYTPDIVGKDPNLAPTYFNYPTTNAQGVTLDMVDNGKFAALTAFQRTSGVNYQNEKISGKLKTGLTVGETYTLSYDVMMVGHQGTFGPTYNTWAGLNVNNMNVNTSSGLTPWTTATTMVDQPITVSYGSNTTQGLWQHVSVDFVADQSYMYVALGLPYTNTAVPSNIYSIFDNVSIKRANRNQISGVVYTDLNGDHTRNGPGEPGINGVQVGLFDSATGGMIGQSTLTDTVQTSTTVSDDGHYSFPYLALPASGNYYVALITENSFLPITEPLVNTTSLLAGKQYVQQVSFTGGFVSGVNFGVLAPNSMSLNTVPKSGCKQGDSGVDLSVTGGTAPFTYSWNNGQFTTEDLNGVPAGTYNVTVTDSLGLTATTTTTIPPYATISITGNVATSNGAGNINITASGIAPLSYNWNNGSTNEDLIGVPPGTYTVIVSDANKCTQTMTFTVTLPQAQSGSCCKIKPNANPLIDCSDPLWNLGNSSVEYGRNRCVQANNGNSCYWDFSNPACCYPGAQGCGSTAGTTCAPPSTSLAYPFSALNASGPNYENLLKNCMNQAQQSGNPQTYYCCVNLPQNISLSASVKPSCKQNGSAVDLTVSSGTAPYTYIWSNGATTQDLSNLASGNYTVTVTDATGASGSLSVTVTAMGPIVVTGTTSPATPTSYNNGAIDITVNPIGAYSYSWTKSGGGWSSTVEDPQNLVPGTYSVTVSNKICKGSKSFSILKKVSKDTVIKQ